jgi:multisubunit Na+/H+ antiporter MnhB subunit
MTYLILIIIGLGIMDMKEMKAKNLKRERAVYVILMLFAAVFGILYFSNPDQESFTEILLSIIGWEV